MYEKKTHIQSEKCREDNRKNEAFQPPSSWTSSHRNPQRKPAIQLLSLREKSTSSAHATPANAATSSSINLASTSRNPPPTRPHPLLAAAQCDTGLRRRPRLLLPPLQLPPPLRSRCARLHETEARPGWPGTVLLELSETGSDWTEKSFGFAHADDGGCYHQTGSQIRQDVQDRRMRMYNQQIQRMGDGQNQPSIVGTTSYEFARNNNYIGWFVFA